MKQYKNRSLSIKPYKRSITLYFIYNPYWTTKWRIFWKRLLLREWRRSRQQLRQAQWLLWSLAPVSTHLCSDDVKYSDASFFGFCGCQQSHHDCLHASIDHMQNTPLFLTSSLHFCTKVIFSLEDVHAGSQAFCYQTNNKVCELQLFKSMHVPIIISSRRLICYHKGLWDLIKGMWDLFHVLLCKHQKINMCPIDWPTTAGT